MDNLEQRLANVFTIVFPELPPEKVHSASQDSVENWDSVAAITLMNVIEEEFGVQMDFDEAADLTSFPKVLEYLKERGAQTAV